MGWFGALFSSSDSDGGDDPLRKLDPKLREFLERESPVKVHVTSPAPAETTTTGLVSTGEKQTPSTAAAPSQQAANGVPRASLYQDGRYAHLWNTYRPLSAVEAETKSDHEKLMDVLEGFKERKSQIGRAALENCADEQLDWAACMKSGGWAARMTMCRKEVRRFERCYSMQSRLLKSLGYLSVYDRPPEVDEQIQMHADTLYHRMLEQEAAIDAAKAEGMPVPVFPPLVSKPTPSAEDDADLKLDADTRKRWQEKLEKVAEEDRAAEEDALKADRRAKLEVASRIQSVWEEQAKERASRKEKGEESVMDKVSSLIGRK